MMIRICKKYTERSREISMMLNIYRSGDVEGRTCLQLYGYQSKSDFMRI